MDTIVGVPAGDGPPAPPVLSFREY